MQFIYWRTSMDCLCEIRLKVVRDHVLRLLGVLRRGETIIFIQLGFHIHLEGSCRLATCGFLCLHTLYLFRAKFHHLGFFRLLLLRCIHHGLAAIDALVKDDAGDLRVTDSCLVPEQTIALPKHVVGARFD